MSDAFESTDDIRSAKPLKRLESVHFDGPIPLALGGTLDHATVAYETWGTLNADRSNAVMVCHAISGDSHCASHPDEPDDEPGWWEPLVGPGRWIDTDEFFVICPNILGGCRGSTGPISINPATGQPFGPDFPHITMQDMVDQHIRLLDHLGISQLRAIVGGSLGGHQALTLATCYPDRTQTCVAVATSPRLTSQALAFDVVARNAIQRDPDFHGGHYYGKPTQPLVGLAIARMLGHITYLSSEAMDAKFDPDRHKPRDVETAFEKRFSVGSYLAHQGQKFVERFDANSYITISMAMDLYDLGRTLEQKHETFRPATCDFLVVSFSSDWLFPPGQSRDMVQALTDLGKSVTYCEIPTDAGHDAFLLDEEMNLYGPLVAAKLGRVHDEPIEQRHDDDLILSLIPDNASVLDLGCGDGDLLARLRDRHVGPTPRLCGVEVNQRRIINTARRGLDVIDYDLNVGLPGFVDQSFDVVTLSATLQNLDNVEQVIDEMLRVGKQAIVSFPNFAYHELRDMFAKFGRLPKAPGQYAYDWYNTPNRRFPSITDFDAFCQTKQITVQRAIHLHSKTNTQIQPAPMGDPNRDADTAVYVLSR